MPTTLMPLDLVQVTTGDGVRLDGVLESPAAPLPSPDAVDAWVCLHGTGSNFYSATLLAGLAPRLLQLGAAVLRVNTRGHDLVSTAVTARGKQLQGAAYECVGDAPHDVAAWIDLLRERGYARIGLLGHSLGAVKAIYALAQDKAPAVAALVAVSPPRLSHAYFRQSARGDEFRATFAAAEEHIRAGRPSALMEVKFPLSYLVSAAGYVDRYGPDERYNVLRYIERIACPMLVSYGSREMQTDVAFRDMPEAIEPLRTAANRLQTAIIAGADHLYTGCHDALAERIESWLRSGKLARSS